MASQRKDVTLPVVVPTELAIIKHQQYLETYGENVDSYEFTIAEYLRVSGMYWTVTCLDLLQSLETSQRFNKIAVVEYVKSCQKPSGGFSPHPNHDENLLHSFSAVQILATMNCLEDLNKEGVISYVVSLQQEDGSFVGDKWGEVDTRFSMCGLACLALLGSLDRCDRTKAFEFIRTCQNIDGGFGTSPGSESHAAMVYCSLGSLAILNKLDIVDADRLGFWLAKRQLPSGGLNGRPEKLPDVCYSWWVLASLAIIGRLHWIDAEKLKTYILACQDVELGGIADQPGDLADPFHTVFGIAGISLLSCNSILEHFPLKPVNPVFCMAQEIIDRLGCLVQSLSDPNR